LEGKRLHFKTQDEARAEAERKAIERRNSGTEVLVLSSAQQKDAIRAFALLEERGSNASLVEMVQGYLKHLAKIETPILVSDLVEKFKTYKAANPKRPLSQDSLDDIRDCLKVYVEGKGELQGWGTVMVHEITHRQVSEWLDAMPHSRTTKRKYRSHLNQLFEFAVKRGFAGDNPVENVEEIAPNEPPKGKLTVLQSRMLLLHADPSIKLGIAIGLFAGLRPQSEICELQWEDIHCKKETLNDPAGKKRVTYGQIDVKASNGSTDRLVDIEENLYHWITKLRPKNAIGAVTKKYDRFNKLLLDASKKAAIGSWPYDGLRHTYCTMHFAAFRNEGITMANSGHRQVRTFRKHYRTPLPIKTAFEYWKIIPM
jgi:integrase